MRRTRSGEEASNGDSYAIDAFLAVRGRFHLAYRLSVRLMQFASVDGGARTAGWRLALLAFVALDIGLWVALRNPRVFALKSRLAIDCAGIAFWSLAPLPAGTAYILAVLAGFPLALDAGLRCRSRGLVVPVAAMATTLLVRSIAGRPAMPEPFVWLFLGVAWGVLLRRYTARLQRHAEQDRARRSSAEHRRAYLAGQNSVAMGASSAVDGIESVLPLLGPPEPGSVIWDIANSWKRALHEATIGHAAYLGQALAEWAAGHNAHPDLASRVIVAPVEGIGTTLLTHTQVEALWNGLTGLDLRGRVAVDLAERAAADRPPGGRLRLRIGLATIDVPADPDCPPDPVDPGPAIFVLACALMLGDIVGFPLDGPPVLAVATMTLLAAWWAHTRLRRLGRAAWPVIMLSAVAVAVTYTACATLALKEALNPAGLENYPVVAGLDLLAIVAPMYWDGLGRPLRAMAVAGSVSVMAVAWLLHPVGDDAGRLLLQATWSLNVLLSARRLTRELNAASTSYAERLRDEGRDAEQFAFRMGQAAVVALVRRAREEASERLRVVGDTLMADLAEDARRRLEEVDLRLASVTGPGGSSSSTTTS